MCSHTMARSLVRSGPCLRLICCVCVCVCVCVYSAQLSSAQLRESWSSNTDLNWSEVQTHQSSAITSNNKKQIKANQSKANQSKVRQGNKAKQGSCGRADLQCQSGHGQMMRLLTNNPGASKRKGWSWVNFFIAWGDEIKIAAPSKNCSFCRFRSWESFQHSVHQQQGNNHTMFTAFKDELVWVVGFFHMRWLRTHFSFKMQHLCLLLAWWRKSILLLERLAYSK
jgi:hypothetical protein